MTINYETEHEEALPFDGEALAEKVIIHCLDFEKCPYETEVNVLITSNSEIRKMNQQFRGMDKATDVLSFPLIEYKVPADFSEAEKQTADCFHPETGELMLGDIVISQEQLIAQADEYGHTKEREFAFLIAHSMLHLMGYDHIEAEERVLMERKQAKILEELKILR